MPVILANLEFVIPDGSTPVTAQQAQQPLSIQRFSTGRISFAAVGSNGTAFSLTGYTPVLTVRKEAVDPVPTVSIEATVTDAAGGLGYFPLVTGHTLSILPGEFIYDGTLIEDSSGNEIPVVITSPFTLSEAATVPGDPVSVPASQQPLAQGPAGDQGPPGPAPAGGTDGQIIRRVSGSPAWSDERVPDATGQPNGNVLTASSGAWTSATPAREVPDPSSAPDGDILSVLNGAYVIAPNLAAQPSRSGLISEWLLDEGQGATAFNNVYPHQPALNIWGPILLSGDFVNATPTLNFAESPAGGFTALRVQFTGNAYYDHAYPFVNGRHYTISVYARSSSGGNQKFRMASDAIAYSSDFTATTSWQRFSYTFTASGGINFFPMSTDAAAENADILFWGLQLDNGDHPTPYVTPNFGMTLGLFPNANDSSPPTWNSGGYLHFASAGSQYARSISEQPISSYQASIYVVFRRVGSTNINGLAPLLGAPGLSLLQIDYGSQNGIGADLPNFLFTNQSVGATATSNDGAWHLLCGVIDGSALRIYLDDTEVAAASISGSVTPLILYSLLLGNLNESAYFAGDLAYASVYSVGHTQAQYLANRSEIQALMAARSISIPDLDAFVAYEGDSITSVDVGTPPYATLEMRALLRQGRIFATSGSKVSNMTSRAATVDALYKASRRRNILSILIGRNDLDVDSPSTFVTNLKNYCLARRSVGWTIVLKTILPSTESGFDALRNSANALIVADPSFYDFLVRLDLDPTIGQDGDASNLTYYSDGTHPTNAGCAIIAADEEPTITAALA